MRVLPKIFLVFFALLLSGVVLAQGELARPTKTSYHLLKQEVDTLMIDTLTSGSQIYNPLYSSFPAWSELGNLGFPALPNQWNGISRLNEPHYLRSLSQYTNPENRLIQYQTNSPYALLNYTSGGSQDVNGQLIRAVFARPVRPGVRFTALLDFVSSPGHYRNQSANQSSFTFNLDVDKKRYKFKAGVESLQFKLGENGGLYEKFDDSDNTSSSRSGIPVRLNNGASSTSWTIIQGRQEFDVFAPKLNKSKDSVSMVNLDMLIQDSIATDSLVNPEQNLWDSIDSLPAELPEEYKSRPKLFHIFNYQFSKRLYKDEQSEASSFYSNFLIHDDLAEDSVGFKSFNNMFGLSYIGLLRDSIQWMGQLGMYHQLSTWASNELSGNFQQAGAFANVRIENRTWLAFVDAKLQLFGYGIGSYDLDFRIARKDQSDGWNLSLGFQSIMDQPSIFYQVFSGNHERWLTDLRNQQEQSISFIGEQERWKFSVEGQINLISNWVYFDAQAEPQQSESSAMLGSAMFVKTFQLGPFRSKNQLQVQYSPAVEIPIPLIVAATSTYMHHDILFPKTNGKLEVEYGLVVRYCSSYQGYAYRPSTGAFYLQNEQMLGNYPYVDPFLIVRVKRTRIFVKWEHANAGLTGDNFYPVLNYPVKERFVKYGVYWHFYD